MAKVSVNKAQLGIVLAREWVLAGPMGLPCFLFYLSWPELASLIHVGKGKGLFAQCQPRLKKGNETRLLLIDR